MKKNIVRFDIEKLVAILKNLESTFKGSLDNEFLYIAYKNLSSLQAELETIFKIPALQFPQEYDKYEEKRLAIVNKYAEKNENGSLKTVPNTQDAVFTTENKKKFEDEMKILIDSNAELIKSVEAVNLQRLDFMKQTSEVDVYPIELGKLPPIKTENKPIGWSMDVLSALDNLIIAKTDK